MQGVEGERKRARNGYIRVFIIQVMALNWQLGALQRLLLFFDAQLCMHLKACEVTADQFAIGWLLTWSAPVVVFDSNFVSEGYMRVEKSVPALSTSVSIRQRVCLSTHFCTRPTLLHLPAFTHAHTS